MGGVRTHIPRSQHVSFLTRAAISLDVLLAEVSAPDRGGTCVFRGTVRNGPDEHGVTAIEYSADEAMVEAEFGRLLADARGRSFERPLGSRGLSVTDGCNLRCRYCMPEDEYVWLPRTAILTFEEIERLVGVFARLGVHKVRLTGGEPLLRHDLPTLVAMIARDARITDLALTTNGLLLAKHAAALQAAGLQRATVSLDTLRPERMLAFAKCARHADLLEGIAAARKAGFAKLKLNAVVIRGFNDDELADLVEFARTHDAEVRFIEYMDVGGATRWSMEQVVSQREMLEVLARRYGAIEPIAADGRAPAERFRLADGTSFGIIASTTAPFCRACDRRRPTADR